MGPESRRSGPSGSGTTSGLPSKSGDHEDVIRTQRTTKGAARSSSRPSPFSPPHSASAFRIASKSRIPDSARLSRLIQTPSPRDELTRPHDPPERLRRRPPDPDPRRDRDGVPDADVAITPHTACQARLSDRDRADGGGGGAWPRFLRVARPRGWGRGWGGPGAGGGRGRATA